MKNKKASMFTISRIMVGIITLAALIFVVFLNIELPGDFKAGKECRLENPDREFCNYIKAGIECGYKCEELGLEFYRYERGGVFANDKCVCEDSKGYPHTMY